MDKSRQDSLLDSVLGTIGNTPLVELSRITRGLEGRILAREEGIFAGFSSGANVAAAMQLLRTSCRGKTMVVLLNDSGLKYLSTDLWLS